MPDYYITFGFQYPREPPPTFPEAHHDGWVTIVADNAPQAREIAFREFGRHWSFMYEPAEIDTSYYPKGELARFDGAGRVCPTCALPGTKPSHDGSPRCQSGSIASGGKNAHCSCGVCF